MKLPMWIATLALTIGAFTLSGCAAKDAPAAEPTTSRTASPSASATTATTPAAPSSAADLVGDWQDVKAEWTVHFKDDGTYVEDFQGIKDFRVGKYEVAVGEVSLIGDDGDTDKGTVEGQSVTFKLGTLTRK